MGFTKRFITEELIMSRIKSGHNLTKIFNVDALIFQDKISSKIYELHIKGYTDTDVFKVIKSFK